MKTDKELYELYTSDPDELYKILDRTFPNQGVDIRTEQNKQIESTSDLYVIPVEETECCHVIANEGRSEKNIHSRGLISAGLFVDKYPGRQHEVHLIYLTRSLDPYATTTSASQGKTLHRHRVLILRRLFTISTNGLKKSPKSIPPAR